jgi:ferredoxin
MDDLLCGLRKKFFSSYWDPRRCTLEEIKRRFAEHEGDLLERNISFHDFNSLYRRASCEAITECWKETRAKEKGDIAPSTTIREGVCSFPKVFLIYFYFSHIFAETCSSSTRKMTSLFESSSDDDTFDPEGEAEEVDEEKADEEMASDEGDMLVEDLKSPPAGTRKKTSLGSTFARMSIGPGSNKMIAVVDDDSLPYPTIHSEWKDTERQMRLSLAVNLPSGSNAFDLSPIIATGGRKITISKKWSKQLFQVNKVLQKSFLKKLAEAGQCRDPDDEMDDDDYPFHQVSIAQGLEECIEALKNEKDDKGDVRPTITFNVAVPLQLDRLFCDLGGRLTNTFDLYGLEGEKVSTKSAKGLWHQTLIIEGVNHRSTYEDPEGPGGFQPVQRTLGGWANPEDAKVPDQFKITAALSTSSSKRARASKSATELLEEQKKTTAELQNAQRMRTMLDAISQAQLNEEANDLRMEQMLGEAHDKQEELHTAERHLFQLRSDNAKLSRKEQQFRQLAEEASNKYAEMEACANFAVANAKIAAEAVVECLSSCSACIDACEVGQSDNASEAATAARSAGERAFQAAKKAADVSNPSPISHEAYEKAKQQAIAAGPPEPNAQQL